VVLLFSVLQLIIGNDGSGGTILKMTLENYSSPQQLFDLVIIIIIILMVGY